jgi:hypothetical protein
VACTESVDVLFVQVADVIVTASAADVSVTVTVAVFDRAVPSLAW